MLYCEYFRNYYILCLEQKIYFMSNVKSTKLLRKSVKWWGFHRKTIKWHKFSCLQLMFDDRCG